MFNRPQPELVRTLQTSESSAKPVSVEHEQSRKLDILIMQHVSVCLGPAKDEAGITRTKPRSVKQDRTARFWTD